MQKIGNVSHEEMMRTFNMGVGMVLVVPPAKFKKAMMLIDRAGEKAYVIGKTVKGEHGVHYTLR
jgi:phosphoribosylformylglycinamidine cyclo-ligase